ncbi:Piwi-domain-containing protein [Corynespora cassiicola Philippines]|uniref:Piwi-domain-containing protein n=1 Tax=Corynespora cassiicola Philippines TaxID=1448308 RepID=A0A2T2NL73_CORCC|nr:Piwi-domain-containing protein [Corynespora cassiicola Philippines]
MAGSKDNRGRGASHAGRGGKHFRGFNIPLRFRGRQDSGEDFTRSRCAHQEGAGTPVIAPFTHPPQPENAVQHECVDLSMGPVIVNMPTTNIKINSVRVNRPDTKDNIKALQSKAATLPFPPKDGVTRPTSEVATNHFQIGIAVDQQFYRYTILTQPPIRKNSIRDIFKTTIDQCDLLKNNEEDLVTDYNSLLVAWTSLHDNIEESKYPKSGQNKWELIRLQHEEGEVQVHIEFEGHINVKQIMSIKNMHPDLMQVDIQQDLRALNLIVSKGLDRSGILSAGPNEFFIKVAREPLTTSLFTLRGYTYQIKLGMGALLLNVNSLTRVFFSNLLLSEVLMDFQTFPSFCQSEGLMAHLGGLQVCLTYERKHADDTQKAYLNSHKARIKTIAGFGAPFGLQTSYCGGDTRQRVEDFLRTSHNVKVYLPSLPAVNLGTTEKPEWYAPECLQILPWQYYRGTLPEHIVSMMHEVARHRPAQEAPLLVDEALEAMVVSKERKCFLRCPSICIEPELVRVPSSTLPFPDICYADQKIAGGISWNLANKKFYRRKRKDFSIAVISDCYLDKEAKAFLHEICVAADQTFGVAKMKVVYLTSIESGNNGVVDPAEMRKAMDPVGTDINFFFWIPRVRSAQPYACFKSLADREFGIPSQCITKQKLGVWSREEKIANFIMKTNLKTGGSNHTVEELHTVMNTTLVLGADVVHTGDLDFPGTPSIAAVVGSVDKSAGRFLGSMRLQHRPNAEIIDELESMVCERIKDWVIEQKRRPGPTGKLPQTIYYYRDGVSESQFEAVRDEELPLIESAFAKAAAELDDEGHVHQASKPVPPEIMAMIVSKRNDAKFYPLPNTADRYGNTHPGTLVDDVITSPYLQDFFLQSHSARIGTARPTHYFVIRNDPRVSTAKLCAFTHQLCFTYVRTPGSVSYASPAYYADRLCDRGMQYLLNFFENSENVKNFKMEHTKFNKNCENALRRERFKLWGPSIKKGSNGKWTRREKTLVELEQEQLDRALVDKECERWSWELFAKHFYVHGMGKNPWHPNITKTMFWMNCSNNNINSDMYYPATNNSVLAGASGGTPWRMPEDVRNHREVLKIENPTHPIRERFSKTSGTVVTNHFNYTVDADTNFWLLAMEQWSFLNTNRQYFATTHTKLLVAWRNFHQAITETPTAGTGQVGSTWSLDIAKRNRAIPLRFNFVQEFNTNTMLWYANVNPEYEATNFSQIANGLNMIVNESLDLTRVHEQSANKFFPKNAGTTIRSNSLEIIRGYFYNVKPGMENFIFNFNLAHSAFFRPIIVSHFLLDTHTFPNLVDRLNRLKGLRVYIEYERKPEAGRISTVTTHDKDCFKKIRGFSEVIIGKLEFQKILKDANSKFLKNPGGSYHKADESSNVASYLEDTFNDLTVNWLLLAVNVAEKGGPIWYSHEMLRIVTCQIYNRNFPEYLIGDMVRVAAKAPRVTRCYIENEELVALGFTPNADIIEISLSERNQMVTALEDAKKEGAYLTMLMMANSNVSIYVAFKDLVDRIFRLQSICMVVTERDNSNDYMLNVSMKVNLKFEGTNHIIQGIDDFLFDRNKKVNTMILGADVVHPGSSSISGCLFISAIVGSVDKWGARYLGSMRLQSVGKTDHGIIDEVEAMVEERPWDWTEEPEDENSQ